MQGHVWLLSPIMASDRIGPCQSLPAHPPPLFPAPHRVDRADHERDGPIRYAEIAVPGNDRKERVSESTRVITIGSSCAFSAQTLASMSSGA